MKKIPLKSKELNRELVPFGIEYSKKDQVVLLEDKGQKVVLVNNVPEFFYHQDQIVPTLKHLQKASHLLKTIVVDMGAVKFVINGADIMRPGIVEIEAGIKENDLVVIIDVNNRKPLAVGIALFAAEEMKSKDSGKVIKNIHWVGDELWRLE